MHVKHRFTYDEIMRKNLGAKGERDELKEYMNVVGTIWRMNDANNNIIKMLMTQKLTNDDVRVLCMDIPAYTWHMYLCT